MVKKKRTTKERERLLSNDIAHLKTLAQLNTFEAVVVGHAWVEQSVIRLLELSLVHPKRLEIERAPHAVRFQLLAAMDEISEKDLNLLKVLNDIRNHFGHDPEPALTPNDEQALQSALTKLMPGRKAGPSGFYGLFNDLTEHPGYADLTKMPNVDKLVREALLAAFSMMMARSDFKLYERETKNPKP